MPVPVVEGLAQVRRVARGRVRGPFGFDQPLERASRPARSAALTPSAKSTSR
nr:hypothetical protein [Frankia sp. ACN10a]